MIKSIDPREIIGQSDMGRLQVMVIFITVLLNALDGFDVMAISFASSLIGNQWGITKTELGVVMSAELIGMALGSIFLGGVADRMGRRKTIIGCLMAMTVGMFMVTTTASLLVLGIWRVFTGLGIGGMLASINAMAAEFSNTRRKYFSVCIMSIGYPLGGVFGGMAVSYLLGVTNGNWHSIFYFGTSVTMLMIPVCYFFMPESVYWLARKQPEGALDTINRTLTRMGHAVVSALPAMEAKKDRASKSDLFGPMLFWTTTIVTVAYFLHITTFYFILKWVPDLVVQMGFDPRDSSGVLTWASVGGATGGALFGFLTLKFDIKKLTIGAMLLGAVFTGIFGQVGPDLIHLSVIVAITGIFTNGAIVGMYALLAQVFPTHLRATGTGFAVGVGRGGSMLAPFIAGVLLDSGMTLPVLAPVMGLGSLSAALVLFFLKVRNGDELQGSESESDKPESSEESEDSSLVGVAQTA